MSRWERAVRASLVERAREVVAEAETLAPRRAAPHPGVDFRPLIDYGAMDVPVDHSLRRPDAVRPPAEVSCGFCSHRELANGHRDDCPTIAQPVVWPEPWLTCPHCALDGWHLIEHRPGMAGVFASWPDPMAERGAHWLRTCVWCWREWQEPA